MKKYPVVRREKIEFFIKREELQRVYRKAKEETNTLYSKNLFNHPEKIVSLLIFNTNKETITYKVAKSINYYKYDHREHFIIDLISGEHLYYTEINELKNEIDNMLSNRYFLRKIKIFTLIRYPIRYKSLEEIIEEMSDKLI